MVTKLVAGRAGSDGDEPHLITVSSWDMQMHYYLTATAVNGVLGHSVDGMLDWPPNRPHAS